MKDKDPYLYLEFVLTFFLLILVIFLLEGVIHGFKQYLIFGLICGSCFSWFNRGSQSRLIPYFIIIAALGIFVWMIYSTMNSYFFYKDVISIGIKGALILEILLSFGTANYLLLCYMQAVSVPLFMSFPIFIKGYQPALLMLILGYFLCWLFILKAKFYRFIPPQKQTNVKLSYFAYSLIILLIVSILISRILFSHVHLGEFKKGWLFFEKGKGVETGLENLEVEYYDLQDNIQKEVTRLIPELKSKEERYEVLDLLGSFIKESTYILEVKKAASGLIDYLKRPGMGLEKGTPQEKNMIADYLDKKAVLNFKRTKDDIMNILKNSPFNIKERISIFNRINKMQYSNSFEQIQKYERDYQKIIKNSSVNMNTVRELKELAGQLREWKTFEIYLKKLDSLNKKVDSLDRQSKGQFADLSSEIDRIEELSDLKNMDKKIKKLKVAMSPQFNKLVKEIEEILDLKLEMFLSEKGRKLKDKLGNSNLSEYELKELREGVDNIKDAEDYQNLSKDFLEFGEKTEEKKIDISKEIEEVKDARTYRLTKERKEKIEDILKESTIPDTQKKNFLRDLEKWKSAKDSEKLISYNKKIESAIDKFLNQGFISGETKDKLVKEINELKNLSLAQDESKEKYLTEQSTLSETQRKWEELIESSSFREVTKDTLKQLTEELSKADTISKVENIKRAIEEELDSLSKEGIRKDEINKLKSLVSLQAALKENELEKETALSQVRKEQKELIESSSFREVTKDTLKQLTEELSKADTISKVENIKRAIEEELDSLSKEGIRKDEVGRLKETFNELAKIKEMFIIGKNLSFLTEKLEYLKEVNPKEAEKLEGYLKKISQSSSNEDLEKSINALKEYSSSLEHEPEQIFKEAEKKDSLQIYILPSRLVMPVGSSVSLKIIAVYNHIFIKEISPELEWFSSQPYIARVDDQGIVHSLSKGKAQISANYKGRNSEEVEVIVVDKIDEQVDKAVKKELVR